ncbi:MAG: hypothetical protein U0169_05855 [Polyangiaceae bacterium]
MNVRPFGFALLGFGLLATCPSPADASVSIAVLFEDLLEQSSAAGVLVPAEEHAVWEGGRIVTYTRLRMERAVAGDVGTGQDVWVRSLGGVVGDIGQRVDGEATFTMGRPSLLFLQAAAAGTWVVSARAQGQFPIVLGPDKAPRLMKSAQVGVLLAPGKDRMAKWEKPGLRPLSAGAFARAPLASDVLAGKTIDEIVSTVSETWKTVHAK